MKKTLLLLAFIALQFSPALSPVYADSGLNLFKTEQAAKHHCPSDIIVWLNLPTGIYHFKGQHWYNNTKYGSFVCEKEADASGDRASQNGQ